jgi:hydroxyacylglutathione hydrolase
MIHEILPVGMLACNCSIIGDEDTREGMVIDPGDDVDAILRIVARHGLRITLIVVTHAHIDHIGGARKLKDATGAPVYMSAEDIPLYDQLDMQAAWLGVPTPDRTAIDTPAHEGERLRIGSISLWIPAERKVIAGDTLFRDSIGRTDLPGGDGRRILLSIREKLMPLPDETVVIPGHGESTTIAREKEFNTFLRGLS